MGTSRVQLMKMVGTKPIGTLVLGLTLALCGCSPVVPPRDERAPQAEPKKDAQDGARRPVSQRT
jgi:hypothetical protein